MSMQLPLGADGEPVKRCPACGLIKPLTEFHLQRSRRDGHQSRCKPCNIERAKRFHAEHRDHARARISIRAKRIRNRNRRMLLGYLLEHPCVDCGEKDPVVLELDHLRDKIANVTALVNRPIKWQVIADEIAKCEVVCANCHRRRTIRRVGGYRIWMLDELNARDT